MRKLSSGNEDAKNGRLKFQQTGVRKITILRTFKVSYFSLAKSSGND